MMKIKVLTIPKHRLRNFAMLGHLETIGVDVVSMLQSGDLAFYEGYDYREKNPSKIEMISQWYADRGIKPKSATIAARAIEWGFYAILEKIASENEPSLVLESDVRLQWSWSELNRNWRVLCDLEGYNRIKVVQLKWSGEDGLEINGIFQNGGGCGQMGNIWTPHGAEFLFVNKEWNGYGGTLESLPFMYRLQEGLYKSVDRAVVKHSKFAGAIYNQHAQGIQGNSVLTIESLLK